MLVRLLFPAHVLLLGTLLLSNPLSLAATPSKSISVKARSSGTSSKPQTAARPVPMLTNFTFRGNHIGEPANGVIERSIEPAYQAECLAETQKPALSECSGMLTGIPHPESVTSLNYQFFENKLSGFTLFFPLFDSYSEINAMLEGKYGPAHRHEHHVVSNAMGGKFDQLISIWNTPYGPMKLYFRYPSVDMGYLILENRAVEKKVKALEAKQLQEKGKSVF